MVKNIKVSIDTSNVLEALSALQAELKKIHLKTTKQTNRINEVALELRKHAQEMDTYAVSIVGEEATMIIVMTKREVSRMRETIDSKSGFIEVGGSYFRDYMVMSIVKIS